MELTGGAVFAGYTVVRLLGAGGMGEVYLVQHPRLPRRDALKVLPQELTNQCDYRDRFTREADLASSLWHPHIVGVYDRGEFDGHLWIAMHYVDGWDASRLLGENYPSGMPALDVAALVTAVGGALDYAHSKGLLHRDVKPSNILLTRADDTGATRTLLTDFGIARRLDDISGLTITNMAVGTMAYSAPEQLMDYPIDGRADQYSLAATAYHLLTGHKPFPQTNPGAVISAHLTQPPPPVSARRPDLAGLDEVFAFALAKNPGDRFRTCSDFANALQQRIGGGIADRVGAAELTLPAPRVAPAAVSSPPVGAHTPARGKRMLIGAVAVCAVLAIAAIAAVVAMPKVIFGDGAHVTETGREDARLTAQHYLEALAGGHASAALALGSHQPPSDRFVTDAVLRDQTAAAPITDISVVNDPVGSSSSPRNAQRVILSAKFGGTFSQARVWVRKTPNGWRLDNTTVTVALGPPNARNESVKAVVIDGVPTDGSNQVTAFPGVFRFSSANRLVDITAPPLPRLLDALADGATPPPPVQVNAALNDAGRQGLSAAIEARLRWCYAGAQTQPGCPPMTTPAGAPTAGISLAAAPARFTNMAYGLNPMTMQVHVTGTIAAGTTDGGTFTHSIYSDWDVSKDPPAWAA